MMPKVRTRIAPSPTGDPHIGTFYNALFNFAFAKKNKGSFIVRIEDTDRTRFVEGSEEKLYQAFEWLGIKPDEGPIYGGNFGPYRQSERLGLYKKYALELIEKGVALTNNVSASSALAEGASYAYYCFCSAERLDEMRKEQQTKGIIPPKYDRTCLKLSASEVEAKLKANEPFVIRLKVPDQGVTSFIDLIRGQISFENKLIDDQVLLKSDGFPTYHLAVVVDDHLMEISHVIRGEEWISSTPKQILLYQALGWEIPQFAHTSLLRNPDHSKMSKRKNPTSVFWYKEQGILPEVLINFLALMGWSHPEGKEIFYLEELIEKFDLSRIGTVGPVFDYNKLKWLNGEYFRETQNSPSTSSGYRAKSREKLKSQICDFYKEKYPQDFIEKTIPLVQERMMLLSEYQNLVDFIFEEKLTILPTQVKELLAKYQNWPAILQSFLTSLTPLAANQWNTENLHKLLDSQLDKLQTTPKQAYMILRIALSGSSVGPPLFESMEIMDKEKTIKRLKDALT
ncbi:MAG: Glutamate-tRNA ligase [Parcubacteria group bacterium GW2011_GWA2_39_18]|nr:MAG: Glutamate-tRNA ligase [Parcubacteria group bacterium GW2011_GWA2_39_18]